MLKLPFFNHLIDLPDDSEIVYDMSKDRIGDAIGVLAILENAVQLNPALKMSVLYYPKNHKEYSWSSSINLFEWSKWKPYRIYHTLPTGKFIFDSISGFSIWQTLYRLKLYPKLQVPDNIKINNAVGISSISMHVLNAVDVRNQWYVSHRATSMEKYEHIAEYLIDNKIVVTRLGAAYDRVRDFNNSTIDLTSQNLSLHDTFIHLAASSIFMGGDTGLTHAAAAFGIPVIVEIDSISKSALGLAGIPLDLLTEIPYNCSLEMHKEVLRNHPLLKDKL